MKRRIPILISYSSSQPFLFHTNEALQTSFRESPDYDAKDKATKTKEFTFIYQHDQNKENEAMKVFVLPTPYHSARALFNSLQKCGDLKAFCVFLQSHVCPHLMAGVEGAVNWWGVLNTVRLNSFNQFGVVDKVFPCLYYRQYRLADF